MSLEQTIEAACAAREIPGAILLAADKSGKFKYERCFGAYSAKEPHSEKPLDLDAVFWIASCTKLLTTIAVMQCVERGQLSLDDDVTSILHEWKNADILTGFEEGTDKPISKRASKPFTLRQMLTHSTGISYDIFNPILQKWRAGRGEAPSINGTVPESCLFPLLFEPGEAWEYSVGIDWAGEMVKRVNGGQTLQSYFQQHIWKPLGISDMTFHLEQREDLRKRLMDMSLRAPPGAKEVVYQAGHYMADPTPDDRGGGGLYASAPDYIKVLQAVLAKDGTLLKPETFDEMFQPQLSTASKKSFTDKMQIPWMNLAMGYPPMGAQITWGLGGFLAEEDFPGRRKKGTMAWGGLPNLSWWIDMEAGLCGLYASQVLPLGDAKTVELAKQFEETMYQRYAATQNGARI